MSDREEVIRAALVGFAASGEGFNGHCAYDGLEPDESDVRSSIEHGTRQGDGNVREAVETALRIAGLIEGGSDDRGRYWIDVSHLGIPAHEEQLNTLTGEKRHRQRGQGMFTDWAPGPAPVTDAAK